MDAKHSANTLRASVTQKRFHFFSFDNFTENFQIRQRPDLSPSELAGLAWGVVQRKRQVNANYTNAKTKTTIVQRQRHCSAVCGAYKEKDIKSFWMAKNVKYTYSACNCLPIFIRFLENLPPTSVIVCFHNEVIHWVSIFTQREF